MALVIRILSGARAGQRDRFEKPKVAVGRHESADLRFDPERDIDVSGRHAEFRVSGSTYVLHDNASTNGTFVNGERVQGSIPLKDMDRVQFGAKGPEVEVRISEVPAMRPSGTMAGRPSGPVNARPSGPVRARPSGPVGKRTTEERVAIAVKEHTRGLKRFLVAAAIVIAAGVGGAYYVGQQASQQQVEQLRQQLERSDRQIGIIQSGIPGDTALMNGAQRQIQLLRDRLPAAQNDAERDTIQADIAHLERQLADMIRMDLPAINARNAPAVAVLVSEIGGTSFAGSAFAIAESGLMLTNRHNVSDANGQGATRIVVKFRDTREWLPASVVKVSSDPDVDLALIRVEVSGRTFPVVAGIQRDDRGAGEGASLATIGFPFGYETAQEGEGNEFLAKTTLNGGTVSKRTSTVLQLDTFAGHGSSGSPVFNARGLVVGVIYGGQREAAGRIVYAVPPDKLAAFIPPELGSVIKD
ncbi:MAG: trypsin-like peptidase domain-containing protein [Gemmatimonadaceae bacterium]